MAEEVDGRHEHDGDRFHELSERLSRPGRQDGSSSQVPQTGIAEPKAELRRAEERQAEPSPATHELEDRLAAALAYAQRGERTIGQLVASVMERDDQIAALERGLSRRARRLVVSAFRPVALYGARPLYHLLVPHDVRERRWAKRHGYQPEAAAESTSAGEIITGRRPVHQVHDDNSPQPRVAIVTRNAIHGGVETMVAQHQRHFRATVFVAGGENRPDTCPFQYTYIDATAEAQARRRLAEGLRPYDVIIYHWIPEWAQSAIRDAGRPSVEVVHREDTSDNDKSLPTVVVTHSQYLADYIEREFGREALVIPHAIDVDRFPVARGGRYIGGITSYYHNKGVDLLLAAWARLQDTFPDYGIRYYGTGADRDDFINIADQLNLRRVELLGPISAPERHLSEFRLFVQPSRSEGMPIALLEALASDIPVITSDLDGMAEVNVQAARNGLPPPFTLFRSEDVDDLACKLELHLCGSERAVDSRAYVRQFYAAERHFDLYCQAIEQAMTVHAGGGHGVAHMRDRTVVADTDVSNRENQVQHRVVSSRTTAQRGFSKAPVTLRGLVSPLIPLSYQAARLAYHVVVPRNVRAGYWELRHYRKHPELKAFAEADTGSRWTVWRSRAKQRPASESHRIAKTLPHVYIFSGVPYHDIGGGQRPAQLANTFNRMGHPVTYVYAYDSSDLGKKVAFTPAIRHVALAKTSPAELIGDLRGEPVFIFELPATGFVPYLELGKKIGARTVYEHIDNWDTSLGTYLQYTRESLCTFIREADVVTVTARPLEAKLRELIDSEPDLRAVNRAIQYCANAVNVELFDPGVKHDAPADLVRGASKTLLYYGSLWGEWFDWELIRAVGRSCPECAINLIGDHAQLAAIKPTLPRNVYFLGPKLQTELPGYLQHVDVTLLPFKNDEIGRYVSPLKVFEYLSMGKPVLATSLPDIAGYPNLFQSDDPEEWVRYVQQGAMPEVLPTDSEAGRDFAMQNSWYSRCGDLLDWCGIETTKLRPGSITVVVLNRNNRSVITRCVDNLLAYRSTYGYDIVVVDNQSTDGSPELLRERYGDRITVLINDRNGCSSGRNLGIRAAHGEYVLFLDSDQWPIGNRWLEAPLAVLRNRRSVGAAGWIGGWPSTVWLGGLVSTSLPHLGIEADALARTDLWYLGSGGLLARREVLELVGGFDVSYDPTCYEDTDLSLAIRDAGFELAYCPHMTIQHQPHQTTNAGSAEHMQLMERNRAYFRSKWSSRAPRLLTDYTFPGR